LHRLPVIDLTDPDDIIARAMSRACRDVGFFYVTGHGVPSAQIENLLTQSRRFFARPLADKLCIRMEKTGRAWRGYFPLGGELTSGTPDHKEGLYFGAELAPDHPDVRAGLPLHGQNQFPDPSFRAAVLEYMASLTTLGHRLMRAMAQSLDLAPTYFEPYTADPFILFRIFHYPADAPHNRWGVGEHTDYGVLTILAQDKIGGLEVRTPRGWLGAPPIANTFVCNLGDMIERLSGGLYRSTPHRVRNTSQESRLSLPFFFDPNFHAVMQPIAGLTPASSSLGPRWDNADPHAFTGTYGDYLLRKVAQVFPALADDHLANQPRSST
jgi:polar amino acid transport system ATP-binding protein